MSLAIGVDLGGTKIAAGVVDASGTILAQDRKPTPSLSAQAVVETIAELVESLAVGRDISAVCVAAPGFVDAGRTKIVFTPNLPIADEPLADHLAARLGIPVVIENDANAAAWAEARFGSGQGIANLVMLTVGTGLGGGIVTDGRLVRGAGGMAAEVGHMCLVPDGQPCGCGQVGCWEQYCSGNALLRTARALATSRRADATLLLSLGDGTPQGVEGSHITTAAQQGCSVSLAAFDDIGTALGRGMASVAAVLDPEMFVIGGGVIDAGDLLLAPARRAFEQHLTGRQHRTLAQIVPASLGNLAGLVGAADLARQA